jgi:uncharacterized repeat protein (TIGR03803 family)
MKRTYLARLVDPLSVLRLTLFAVLLVTVRRAQGQAETVLYNFTGGNDGGGPESGLAFHGGNLYGTTLYGGLGGFGTVFELSPNGSSGWNETVPYSFSCTDNGQVCPDGAYPTGPVIFDSIGNLYGITGEGGNDNCESSTGCGVAFELSPVGADWTETLLYAFCSQGSPGMCPGGAVPGDYGPVGLVKDSAGNLYGTDASGVFELSPSDSGWTEKVIYYVGGFGGLTLDSVGNIFGVGVSGTGQRIVFELSPNGKGDWNPTVIYTFPTVPKGVTLWSALALDQAGNLYGTTSSYAYGAKPVSGSVYKLSSSETGWTKEGVYSFLPSDSELEGNEPSGGLVVDSLGNIYGTTLKGGAYNQGTVFELLAPVNGTKYEEKLLWSFTGTDGSVPNGGLILDSAGILYGTTGGGGSDGSGVAFAVTGIPATTTTVLSSSPNPSKYGQSVILTAVVTANFGAPPNGETVTFMRENTVLGTGTLRGGSASFITAALPGGNGTNLLTAVYGGDSSFIGSKSKVYNAAVASAPTVTTLTSSQNPSILGESVTFTATVTAEFSGTPFGTVDFYDGTTLLKTVGLVKGVAKYPTKALTSGSHSITATYNGTNEIDFAASSGSLTQTVN